MAWSSIWIAEGTIPPLLMVVGIALITFIMVVNLRNRRKRRGNEPFDPRQKLEETKQTHAMRGDLRQMMVELEELTRRFSAQLDAKSRRLEVLLDRADQTIQKLQKQQADPADAPSQTEPDAPTDPVDPLSQQIYNLSDTGKTSMQIAKQLDEQIGKVELILALRQ